ncbi:unnamed protein product [Mytilus edulis]|uniref:DZIP3-like HEPN domain-containing protein n=1 Tax=Mytilus edulis TaxID=6550 RepID=A0A8S3QMG1_MYTED|nr:unnamed protein product [Mytilus edulis]
MSNVNFEKKWECGLTKPEYVTGSNDFSEEQIAEYFCETCTCSHTFTAEWQDLQNKISSLSSNCENDPALNPKTESISHIQTISSKVFLRVTTKDNSNIYEESPGAASLTMLTKEEINFTMMGMIALNIFADVLYDLLKPDKPHLRPRCDCDITYLYSEHRTLNKHIPSNSWGGQWQRIQTTDIAIGDDIERIRLTRNELQHSTIYKLDDQRFNELCNISSDLLKRFDRFITPISCI